MKFAASKKMAIENIRLFCRKIPLWVKLKSKQIIIGIIFLRKNQKASS